VVDLPGQITKTRNGLAHQLIQNKKKEPLEVLYVRWLVANSITPWLDNALMESAIGLCKTELIDRQRSWTGRTEVERETAAWVHWYNTTRLHSPPGLPLAHRLREPLP
jgi:integrase-like protein